MIRPLSTRNSTVQNGAGAENIFPPRAFGALPVGKRVPFGGHRAARELHRPVSALRVRGSPLSGRQDGRQVPEKTRSLVWSGTCVDICATGKDSFACAPWIGGACRCGTRSASGREARGPHFESTLRPQVALLYGPVGAVAGGVVSCSSRSGNETVTVVPTPDSLANPMRPASDATML